MGRTTGSTSEDEPSSPTTGSSLMRYDVCVFLSLPLVYGPANERASERLRTDSLLFIVSQFSHVPKLFCLDCTVLAYSAQWRQMSIPPKAFVCSYSALDDVQVVSL